MASIQGAQSFLSTVQQGMITAGDIALILAANPGTVFNRFDVSGGAVDANGNWLSSGGNVLVSAGGEVINDAYIVSHGMTLDPYYGIYVINPTTGEILVDSNGNFVLSANGVGATPENLTNLLSILSNDITPAFDLNSIFSQLFGGVAAAVGGSSAMDISNAIANQSLTLDGGTNVFGGAAAAISDLSLGTDGGTEIVGSSTNSGEDVGLS